MSLWTALEPPSATVDPGSSTTVRLRLRNTGDVVDEYRFTPVGDLAPYITVQPPDLRLYPGTTDAVLLTFSPPRSPDAIAGPNPYAVQIVPTEHPELTYVPEGTLTITPFSEVRAELVPHTVKGRFRGRPKLAIDNIGNTKLTASVGGADDSDQFVYELRPANVQIDPGRAAFVKAVLRPRRIAWLGRKENHPYQLAVRRSGVKPLQVTGTFVQRGVLPRFLAMLVAMLMGLVVACVAFWFAHKPGVTSLAQEKTQQAAASSLPSPTTPAPPPTTSSPPAATTPPPSSAGGGGGGKKKKKGPPETAAVAVKKLASTDPGRHICYRADMVDKGWTKPACDGQTAGLPGENIGMVSVDIAVSGTKGTGGNGWMQYTGYKSATWTFADDDVDNYLGDPKKSAIMSGFTLSVGTGKVCENANEHGGDWSGMSCQDNHWVYTGTTDDNAWLEAIRLTV